MGAVTAKAYGVFAALLMGFHNCQNGRCFPSYDRIAEAAGCCRHTVAASPIASLDAAGLLSVANRLLRVRWKDELALAWRVRVMGRRTATRSPPAGRLDLQSLKLSAQTGNQVLRDPLSEALDRLTRGIRGGQVQNPDRLAVT
jgi:hypothetical protein